MAEPKAVDDPRLWAIAYLRFYVQDADLKSRKSRRLLERDARYMARAVGNFTLFLMDAVWLPVNYGVHWTDPWVEVDSLRRISPPLRAAFVRRERYRRLGRGLTVFPRRRLRRTARDAVAMLWLAYQAECPDAPLLYGSAPVLEMLDRYRLRFGHSSGPCEKA
ncbi:hypothetical protein ACLGIH_20295 [Streptomyces sp. HMX87]|uniref:hypothetical protein n=1 Tax=Streptomyces sp. HMX87 TaxID=3390849 RepID=UPI003A8541C3